MVAGVGQVVTMNAYGELSMSMEALLRLPQRGFRIQATIGKHQHLVADILLEPIIAQADAARESRTRTGSVIAGMRSRYESLCEHWARDDREERQRCDYGLHF
jgi:hypothetical protein